MINKDESPETFLIDVAPRDVNGKIYQDNKGIKVPNISFEITVHTYKQLEFQLARLCRQFQTLLPDADINLSAGVHNSISNTIMNMASYYGCEKRFVKH